MIQTGVNKRAQTCIQSFHKLSTQESMIHATVHYRKWVLTPDAQLITALGGSADVDPDEHIRAFKHTHTGTLQATGHFMQWPCCIPTHTCTESLHHHILCIVYLPYYSLQSTHHYTIRDPAEACKPLCKPMSAIKARTTYKGTRGAMMLLETGLNNTASALTGKYSHELLHSGSRPHHSFP